MTYRFPLVLSTICAGCSVALIAMQVFSTAFLAALSGAVLYWASERVRISELENDDDA